MREKVERIDRDRPPEIDAWYSTYGHRHGAGRLAYLNLPRIAAYSWVRQETGLVLERNT